MKKIFSPIYDFVKSNDRFGSTFQFTYQKSDKFNTFIGGAFTIIVMVGTLNLMVNTIYKVLSYSEIKTTKNTLYKNHLKSTTPYELTAKDFKIAVKWEDDFGNVLPSDKYSIQAYNTKYINFGTSMAALSTASQKLELEP